MSGHEQSDERLVLRAVVVGVAVAAFGVAFGVAAVSAGMPAWMAVLSTAIGAYGGDLLGDVRDYGLDVAFPAAFVALLAPALRRPGGLRLAVLGAGIALIAMQALPTGPAVLLAGLAVIPALRAGAGVAPPEPEVRR